MTGFVENLVFRFRGLVIAAFVLLTAWWALCAARTHVDASFTKQLPLEHPYIKVFTQYQDQFGGANRVLIAVMAKNGDMFTPEFFNTLKSATDEVFFLPGVDRGQVQSLFTPNVRYLEVVEDGFSGGPVIPSNFQPTPEAFSAVRENIIKSGKVGQLVANDFSGALISARLMEIDPATGEKIDYLRTAERLETNLREKFTSPSVSVHIIGFARIMGDVSAGARGVLVFFAASFLITGLLVWGFSHSLKLTLAPLLTSLVAVVWQMGALNILGYGIDPMSILVPFLVFAIAISHGLQMVRAFRTEVFEGNDSVTAARSAFRQLLIPGGVALLTDTVGFLTMLVIKIETIRELAITASLGVAAIIVTNLFLLPLLLSYQKLPAPYRAKIAARRKKTDAFWKHFCVIMEPGPSIVILIVSGLLAFFAFHQSQKVRIGDLHAGVPELRQDSRYNLDSALITKKFSIGVDVLTVIVESVPNGCVDHEVVSLIDQFEGRLRSVPGVQSVVSIASVARLLNAGWNEGSLKWRVLPRNPQALAQAVAPIETSTGLLNADGSVMPVFIFLADHKAETLDAVADAVKVFREANPSPKARFQLASGNAGVMAATNEVVAAAQFPILLWVFGAVIVLCLLTFRSVAATLCIVAPLALVSWLAYVVMVWLEIGLKTSTLPIIALGVGIGVDYGIYLFARLQATLRNGEYFEDAMLAAFIQTGSSIVFTGLALAIGTGMWVFSDLKFQADMGLLLTFMFLVNMLAAIVILPAMARWFFHHHTRRRPILPL
ncbi:RND transporter [Nibricoccus aquaticus]|uniref:RND transporter n=1 Tax=Nibricoccus aquaticus TaxID=2576891 RepID=A0A290QIP2_9BACT|nr:RND transporter [Nibricoccus aquaticus]